VTDVDFRFHLRPRWPRLPGWPASSVVILTGACAVLFPLAALDEVLTTKESGYADNPGIELAMVITALFVAAVISFTLVLRCDFRLTEDRDTRGLVTCTGLAVLCSALLLAVYSAGTWVPYLLHLDGLSVQDRVEGVELEVEGIILLQAFLAGLGSLFAGSVAGIFAWMYQFAPKILEAAARLPWPWRVGLGVPLLLGLVLTLGALISWLSDGYEPPETLNAGRVDTFTVGMPRLYEEEDIWVVRLSEREFVALYDRGVESGCPLQWRPEFEFMSHRGWFVDTCTGLAYDLTGRCVPEVCQTATLDRFRINTQGGSVIVELEPVIRNPASRPA
jgi:hypothetical protein